MYPGLSFSATATWPSRHVSRQLVPDVVDKSMSTGPGASERLARAVEAGLPRTARFRVRCGWGACRELRAALEVRREGTGNVV